ncbi:MAG: ATP-binding protein [Pseudomonadota bacterium]
MKLFSFVGVMAMIVCLFLSPPPSSANNPDNLIQPNKTFTLSEEEAQFIKSLEPLKVMVDDNFVPLSNYEIRNDSYHGISVDLFRHIALKLGIKYVLLHDPKCTWADKEDLLKSGKIDLLMPVSFTAERASYGMFTNSFYDSYYGVIMKHTESLHIKDYHDLAAYKIGVTKASAIISFILPYVHPSNIVTFGTQEAMYQALRHREIDIALQNKNVFREDRFNMGFIDLTMVHTIVESPRKYSYLFKNSDVSNQLIGIIDRYLDGIDIERLISHYDRGEDELIQRYNEQKNQQKMLFFGIIGLLVLLAMLIISLFNHYRLAEKLKASLTQIQLQQEELQKSEAKLKRAMETSKLGAWEYDIDHDIFLFNDQFYTLLHTTAELEGGYTMSSKQYAQKFVHPDDQYLVGEETAKAINAVDPNYSRRLEHRIICADGEIRSIIVHVRIIKNEYGRTVKTYGANQDITEQRRAEEENKRLQAQLQQAQKMEAIGTLAGGIAHDFNNILGAILGYAEMAKDGSQEGSVVANDIDQVIKASVRAKDLVKQILAFSRHAETERIPVQPAVIIKEALKFLRSSIPTTIDIQQDIALDPTIVLADPTHIHQIIVNLCTNAFHAMEETGGILTISVKRKALSLSDLPSERRISPGNFLEISLKDTGAGMTQDIKEKIFEPYFTTKEVGKGTGMGLAIIHGIVKSYGGFVTCRSQPGKGTVFCVYLPVIKEGELYQTELTEPVKSGNEHILYIDDEEMLAEMGKHMLERLGYRVTMQTNSIVALATFQNHPEAFDLVITDQTMPGMTGSDLARKMLRIKPGLPIILCTGYSTQISKEKADSYGIKGFAMKPLAKKEIAVLIRKVLDARESPS